MQNETTYSNTQIKRMKHAIQLYRDGISSTIIISGGAVKNNYNEAQCMAKYIKKQVPNACIELECCARNTYQNMKFTKQSFPTFQHIIVVSSHSHERRATFFLTKFYSQSMVSPAPEKDPWYSYLREYTRMWIALYWEIRLCISKKSS